VIDPKLTEKLQRLHVVTAVGLIATLPVSSVSGHKVQGRSQKNAMEGDKTEGLGQSPVGV